MSTAPAGLYILPDKRHADAFNILSDRELKNAPQILLARVRRSEDWPEQVAQVTIRPDGMQVILQWAVEPDYEDAAEYLTSLEAA